MTVTAWRFGPFAPGSITGPDFHGMLPTPDAAGSGSSAAGEIADLGSQEATAKKERKCSLADQIGEWLKDQVFELSYTAGGLGTFGGLLGRTDSGEENAQIIESQVFVNSAGQIGYRSTVDTAHAIGPAFVLTNAVGVAVSDGPQPAGRSQTVSSHFELNGAVGPGINLDVDTSGMGSSFRAGPDVGFALNITVGDLTSQQWATQPRFGNGKSGSSCK